MTSILSFAGSALEVPATVTVRAVDLSSELQILGFHEQRKHSAVLGPLPLSTDAGVTRSTSHHHALLRQSVGEAR